MGQMFVVLKEVFDLKRYFRRLMIGLTAVVLSMGFQTARAYAEEIIEYNKPITLGSAVQDTLTKGRGIYSFTLQRSGTLTVQLSFLEGSKSSWGNHGGISLYDLDNKQIKSVSVRDNSSGTDSEVFTVDLMAGDYYLKAYVEGNEDATSTFVVTTNFVDSGESVVDSYRNPHSSQINPIAFSTGVSFTGHVADNGSDDVYKLDLKKGQMVNFKEANRANGVRVNIVNSTNTVNQTVTFDDKLSAYKIFCPSGTYYITVTKRGNGGVYTLRADASKIPDTQLKKVKNKRGRQMQVKFKLLSTSDAAGYQLQYCTDKKFRKGNNNVYISNSDYLKSIYTLNIGKKKTYYVHIRTYCTDNRGNKYFGSWSKAKKVTIRK